MDTAPTTRPPGRVIVIPCSGRKLDHPAPAGELYTGTYYRLCRAAAHTLAGDHGLVLVLSGRHGLVRLDQVLEPYDTRLGGPGSIRDEQLREQAGQLGITSVRDVTVLAGAAYVKAARSVWPHAQAPLTGLGIGEQRQQLRQIRNAARAAAHAPANGLGRVGGRVHPVEETAANGALYDLPYDYRQTERTFTVTVAGPERWDGEKPNAYVVSAYSTALAWSKVLAWFMVDQETVDAYVVDGLSFEGEPEPDSGLFSIDLRPEFARRAALDDLADQATEAHDAWKERSDRLERDRVTGIGRRDEQDLALAEAAVAAWPLIVQLSANDGR